MIKFLFFFISLYFLLSALPTNALEEEKHPSKKFLTKSQAIKDPNFLKTLEELIVRYKRDWKRIEIRIHKINSRSKRLSLYVLKSIHNETTPPKKGPLFTSEETKRIFTSVETHGLNWEEIAKEFPGRDPFSIKNRYYYVKKKRHPPLPDLPLSTLINDISSDFGIPKTQLNFDLIGIYFQKNDS